MKIKIINGHWAKNLMNEKFRDSLILKQKDPDPKIRNQLKIF